MNTWLNYILEANAGLLLFLLVYRLLLHNETQFTYKRVYLLAGILFSLAFPLITMPDPVNLVPSLEYALPSEWTDLAVKSPLPAGQPVATPIPTWEWLLYAYLTVVLLMGLKFLYQVGRLLMLIAGGRGQGNIITINDKGIYAFSFFRYIFISDVHNLTSEERERILRHESIHIKKWHSIDLLLIELVRIIFWFNPLLRYYKNELLTVHEYEADSITVKPEEAEQYCSLLAKSAITAAGLSLASHFNNSLTLKRIAMIKAIKTNMKQWKTLFILTITTLFLIVVSCQDQIVTHSPGNIAIKDRELGIGQNMDGRNFITVFFTNVTYDDVNNDLYIERNVYSEAGKTILIGKITSDGRPLQDVYFYIPGEPSSQTITDKGGNFKLTLSENSTKDEIVFESIILLDEIYVTTLQDSIK